MLSIHLDCYERTFKGVWLKEMTDVLTSVKSQIWLTFPNGLEYLL
jgi:hypothetical protein